MPDHCQQENRIGRIEVTVEKISEQVSTMSSDMKALTAVVNAAVTRIEEQDEVLRGENGKPGLVALVDKLSISMTDLYGAMRGQGDKPGLIASIDALGKKIMEWDDTKKWLFRMIVGWFVTTALSTMAYLLKP